MNGPFYEVGVYAAEVISQGLVEARTGTTQFVLNFRVLGKTEPSDPGSLYPVTQYERMLYMPITEKTAERVAENLRQLGYRADSFGPLEPGHPAHESFVGRQIDVYCKHEPDLSGNMRERWQISRRLERKIDPLEAKKVRQLDALFGKTLKAAPKVESVPGPGLAAVSSNGSRQDSLGITDDDIPF